MGMTIISFMGCGSGGSGGSSTNNPAPSPDPAPVPTPPADISVSRTQIAFGDVAVGSFSEETISIQNIGSSNLIIGQIAGANVLSAPFSILSDNCSGMQLAPSQTCSLGVRFSPTTQGVFTDSFDIPSNDPNQNPVTVNVNGFGRALKVSINQVDTDACPKVELLISVGDKDSNPISGLQQNNLSLTENGVLKAITNFYQVASAVSVALIADYSGSIIDAQVIPDMEAASKLFIDQLNQIRNDQAAIIKFACQISLMQDFTTDKAALKAAIDTPYPGAPNYTQLYDAIWYAVDVTAARPGNRAIVVFSDGANDNAPGTPVKELPEVIAYAKGKGLNVFTVGFGNVNEEVMKKLANETGGEYFFAPDPTQLSDIYLLISKIIFGRYLLEFNSLSTGGGTVLLDLEVNYNNAQGRVSQAVTRCP
jgi:Ca-activated chloride channel family protein